MRTKTRINITELRLRVLKPGRDVKGSRSSCFTRHCPALSLCKSKRLIFGSIAVILSWLLRALQALIPLGNTRADSYRG